MHPFPHHYRAHADTTFGARVRLTSDTALAIESDAPPEFGGPPGLWSPESLLVAAVADCFILTFRAVARASKLEWHSLAVDVEGVLDRSEGVTRFVAFTVKPRLTIASAQAEHLALSVMEKSERSCLITNSLSADCELVPSVSVADAAAA